MKGMIFMDPEKQRVVIEGNAFYELDLECLRQREKEREAQMDRKKDSAASIQKKRQRG